MPLQICAFKGFIARTPNGDELQVAEGAPDSVSAANFTGTYTVSAGCKLLKISGTGSIAWPDVANPEVFSGVEWRGVRPGLIFTVA